MSDAERELRARLKDDYALYSSKCLKIRTKEGAVEPFELNKAQKYIHAKVEEQRAKTGRVRAIILKGRQQGCSTYIEGRFYWRVTHGMGLRAFILTHEEEATNNLFDMAKRYHENCPAPLRPTTQASNSKELIFGDIDSGYKLGTAGNKSVGRSSTIQFLHASEAAFYKHADEHAKGILQTVPFTDNTEIFLESTANGVGNWFHQQWQLAESGKSDFVAIFVPWFWQDEYSRPVPDDFKLEDEEQDLKDAYLLTNEQLYWRRMKIIELSVNGVDGKKSFHQEYPCIVGNQRVGTARGIIPIKEVIGNDLIQSGSIKKQWYSGDKDTVAVETALGYRLECTYDHRILKADGNFICAQDSVGEVIKLGIPKFSDEISCVRWNPLPCVESTVIIDEDFALFLGFFMGDGSYSGDTLSIVCDKRDPVSISTVNNLIVKIFGKTPQQREVSANGVEVRTFLKSAHPLFTQLGIIEKKPYGTKRKVHVPEVIWKSPKNVVRQFLRGLFDADGFAAYQTPRISFFSKHTQFCIDVQLLLFGFGIKAKRKHVQKKAGNGSFYMGNELVLRGSESRLFGIEIGFVSERKNSRITEWLDPKSIGRRPIQISLADAVAKLMPLGIQPVYDIELDSAPHVFDAQGVMVHNCTAAEAFILSGEDSYILPEMVVKARSHSRYNDIERHGPILLGCDVARFGDDRTAIIRRQGRVVYGLEVYSKKDTMEVAGILHTIIIKEKPAKVFVDVGGMGAGVVDRLRELGHLNIVAVNSGEKALDDNRFANKRAEMWAHGKEWLQDEPCQLPDSDELHADICGTKYKVDSKGRLLMEKKEDMKKRGVRSSDTSDAWLLTYALPVAAIERKRDERLAEAAKKITAASKKVAKIKKTTARVF
jgi:hypothetical protein